MRRTLPLMTLIQLIQIENESDEISVVSVICGEVFWCRLATRSGWHRKTLPLTTQIQLIQNLKVNQMKSV